MFYSHEILTSREGGLATVWLIATLGSKSVLRKVTRKAILDVDVPRTCNIIIHPDAPMALRLQSNLLYGVSRVFSQQYGYVLSDVQVAQTSMRALLKAVRTSDLDPNAGKARPGQLVVEDDPGFLPDLALPGLDIDLSALDMSNDGSSHRSSLLSLHSLQSSLSSLPSEESRLGLIIPTSDTDGAGVQGGFVLPSEQASSAKRSAGVGRLWEEDNEGFDVDPGFSIDAEGNVIEDPVAGGVVQREDLRFESDSAARGRVRQELQEGLQRGHFEPDAMENDLDVPRFDDQDILLPDAEAFPAVGAQGHEDADQLDLSPESARVLSGRRRPTARALPIDERQELRNSDLAQWRDDYVANMFEAASSKRNHQAPFIAKKNAAFWVIGSGIGGVGVRSSNSQLPNPFAMFTGDALMEALTGEKSFATGRKRSREGEHDQGSDKEARRMRMSDDDEQIGRGDHVIQQEDDAMIMPESEDIEIGRHAQPPLEDNSFPWNTTASALGSRQGSVARGAPRFGSSMGGFPTSAGGHSSLPSHGRGIQAASFDRRASRITSASPLIGRGVERYSSLELPFHDDDELLGGERRTPAESRGNVTESFQLYGDYSGVGSQTQAQSQWMHATLNQEAVNFLDFVRVEIDSRHPPSSPRQREDDEEDELAGDAGVEEGERRIRSVLFEELLPSTQHSKVVAAQALHHVLALATKGLLKPRQEEGYGSITLEVCGES